MPMLMIVCPRTGKYVPTGIAMDLVSFQNSSFSGNSIQCPHCGEHHVWGSEEVRFIEEQAPARPDSG